MTFVRLAGCNAPELGLDCVRWCDTPGSWARAAGAQLEPEKILDRTRLPRLCLTGGEPLLQIEGAIALVVAAHRRGIKVHLETNGTIPPPTAAGEGLFDWAVVSPKPPEYVLAPGWEGLVDELKLVVDERLEAATAERLAASYPEAIVSIQPVWEDGASPEGWQLPADAASRTTAAPSFLARAIRLVMEHPDWRLSVQIHKHLGIR
jgi:organic radical activating enzyme